MQCLCPLVGFRYLSEATRCRFEVLVVARFLFSSRKVFEDCALVNSAYEHGRTPWNSNIPQATVDMQRVHIVFNSRNHDTYPFPSNQFPCGIPQVFSFEWPLGFSMFCALQLFLGFEQFPHKRISISKNHAKIIVIRLFFNFNFVISGLSGGLPMMDLNISTEWGPAWC